MRAAAFKTVTYNLSSSKQNAQPRLEPSEIAGFNQFLFTSNGDTATVYGLGLDGRLSNAMFAGIEFAQRELEAEVVDAVDVSCEPCYANPGGRRTRAPISIGRRGRP